MIRVVGMIKRVGMAFYFYANRYDYGIRYSSLFLCYSVYMTRVASMTLHFCVSWYD